jgi:hypothetical protein
MPIVKSDRSYDELTKYRLENASLLNLFPILYDNEEKIFFLNIFRNYKLNTDMDSNFLNLYQTLEIEDIDWFENISNDLYENPYLWWITPLANNITNPFEEIEPGQLMNVMRKEHIYQLLKEMKNIASL